MSIADLMEHAVHETVERFFEDGKIPKGLAKSIENLVENAAENAVEKMARAQASSSLPASGRVTTSRERPRTSRPTGRDDEGNEDCEFHDVIIIKDKNNKSGVFHSARCHHIDGGLTSSLVKCNQCTNERLKYWSSR